MTLAQCAHCRRYGIVGPEIVPYLVVDEETGENVIREYHPECAIKWHEDWRSSRAGEG